MFRDFFSFAVGAIVALASVMPYDKCTKSLKNNIDSAYAFIARMQRIAEIEVHTGLDVDWIESTRDWTGAQKIAAINAVVKVNNVGESNNTQKALAKVAKQFERNPDLGLNPYEILNKTYLDNRDQIDKKALDSVMEARNADRSTKQLAEALSKHFPGEPVQNNKMEFRSIPGSVNYTPPQPIVVPEIPPPMRIYSEHVVASEFEHRADLVATPDVVERLLDEVAGELDTSTNASSQNEYPSEAVASDS
jgi:hypothetical protein